MTSYGNQKRLLMKTIFQAVILMPEKCKPNQAGEFLWEQKLFWSLLVGDLL
jgi:hypothetical protein